MRDLLAQWVQTYYETVRMDDLAVRARTELTETTFGVRQPQLPLLYVHAMREHTKAVAAATALQSYRPTRIPLAAGALIKSGAHFRVAGARLS